MTPKLDSPTRLSKLTPAMLTTAANPVFDGAVKRAREIAGTPCGVIVLVAKNVQFYRAAEGVAPELAVARAASRCDSFCQFVVKSESAFVVFDTHCDSRVPKRLADLYGIRAYAGVPVRIDNAVVGSLCVYDDKVHDFDSEVIASMSAIAEEVSEELWRQWRTGNGVPSTMSQFAAESEALVRLGDAADAGILEPDLVKRGLAALDELQGALLKSVNTAPIELQPMILEFLDGVPAESRSFALARLVLMTNFPSSREDIYTLQRTVAGAIDKLRAKRG